jgi:hypothetical protein
MIDAEYESSAHRHDKMNPSSPTARTNTAAGGPPSQAGNDQLAGSRARVGTACGLALAVLEFDAGGFFTIRWFASMSLADGQQTRSAA